MKNEPEMSSGLAYEGYVKILEQDNGKVPVCVPLYDEAGNPAILTTSYFVEGFDSQEDYQRRMPPHLMMWTLIRMMHISRDTIIHYGGTPREEVG